VALAQVDTVVAMARALVRAYPLSLRHIEELMHERGVFVAVSSRRTRDAISISCAARTPTRCPKACSRVGSAAGKQQNIIKSMEFQ
jgi:hypothetical protein